MIRKGGLKFMDDNKQKLSNYIDCLNAEKRPKEHQNPTDSPELEELFQTVRQLRSLKEPTMPNPNFPKKLSQSLASKYSQASPLKNKKHRWFTAVASIAAVLFLAVLVNFFLPFSRTDIVYAMEEAFRGVEAYHGFIEIVQTNAEGKSTSQGKLEVWVNKEGHYYTEILTGSLEGLITVNNGQKKWQIRPEEKQVHVFPAFPDAYRFTFELGKEIEGVKNALSYKIIGEDIIAERQTSTVEVTPQGGVPYRLWIDKETKLPLQKEYGMQNALQYTITYSEIEFHNAIPEKLTAYHLPNEFEEINTNPEQIVTNIQEVQGIVGFIPKVIENIPAGYIQGSIAIVPNKQLTKLYYSAPDKNTRVVVIQGKALNEFEPTSNAILGKISNSIVEIQSPIYEDLGVLGGGGVYSGATNINSIRWQQEGFEYAVVGNASLEELVSFAKSLANGVFEIPSLNDEFATNPQVEVPVDLIMEENEQKSVDAGSSPWKLDAAFVAQVFISLKMNPEGITGEYPIQSQDLNIIQNTGSNAIIEVTSDISPIKRVYLQRIIRQDSTGIWTVVGYDPLQ